MLNRTGPSIDSWGTSLVTGLLLDLVPLTTTLWIQPFRQFSTHLNTCSSTPYINSFSRRIRWKTVSKAFSKPR